MEKNEISLSLCIWGFNDISHDELTEIVGVNPSKVFIEGERMNPKFPRLAKENGWFLDSPTDRFAVFSEKMEALLDVIERRRSVFEQVSKKYYCEFSCAIFINNDEESTPSVHLGQRYFQVTKDMKIEFDLDLYCLQNT